MFELIPLVVIFPVLGLLINLAFGGRMREPRAGVIASAAAALSFGVALLMFIGLLDHPEGTIVTLRDWIHVGDLRVSWAFQVDTLSATMMLVVSGVGTLIHIYSIGYMRGDERFPRFFVYMNLFLATMLILVIADNFAMMFIGWEGVGLCSYLLIGFWFDKAGGVGWKNSNAARKAFVVNRVGDFGLLLALFLIFWEFGTLSFGSVFAAAEETLAVGAPVMTLITLLLLVGVTGKSAQIPLYVWLPDAMAGPTPVSALIHAATMVTAGVYLIVRTHFLFELAPFSQHVVTLVGATTALIAALKAIGQDDIKRMLAYSTISQLGFMVTAAGLGAYTASIFHLTTHAFFKALLFMAAGSVVHGMMHGHAHSAAGHDAPFDAQDMRLMGGLRRRMPVTFAVYLAGALALAGLPPLAGFFSKDEILASAYGHNLLAYGLLTVASLGTAFYMGRQIFLVFFGSARTEAADHAAESGRMMLAPLVALALLAVTGGVLNLPGSHAMGHWLAHTLGEIETEAFNITVAAVSTGLALLGIILAYGVYGRAPMRAGQTDPLLSGFVGKFVQISRTRWLDTFYVQVVVRSYGQIGAALAALEQWWGYDMHWRLFIRPYQRLTSTVTRLDKTTLDGVERRIARMVIEAGSRLRVTQTGQLNWNVAGIAGGLIVILAFLLLGRLT